MKYIGYLIIFIFGFFLGGFYVSEKLGQKNEREVEYYQNELSSLRNYIGESLADIAEGNAELEANLKGICARKKSLENTITVLARFCSPSLVRDCQIAGLTAAELQKNRSAVLSINCK